MIRRNFIKSLVASVFIAMLASCSTQNMDMNRLYSALATGTEALTLTNDQLAQYVSQSVAYMDQQNTVAPSSSPYTQRLQRLTKGLNSAGNVPLNFKVYITNDINAFACADGSVRVYSGIMDLMDDDELLGIIGHEVGHVAMEHSKNAFKNQLLNTALREAVASTSSTAAMLTDSQLSQLADAYYNAKYSRKQETEADDFGYDFLKGAGKNPYSMVKAFEKMQTLEGSSTQTDAYLQKMFSSHPETADRIAHITKRCQADGYAK